MGQKAADIATIGRISAVPAMLKVISDMTGLRFAAVARVTEDTWTACAVLDQLEFGMVVGASLSGMLADRFGRKPVFQWSIVLWGIASYLCSTAQTVETLTLFRILLGIGMGMEFPIAQSMLSELIPAKGR